MARSLPATVAVLLFSLSSFVRAQVPSAEVIVGGQDLPRPKVVDGIGVEEHLGTSLPLDARFRDERGNLVRLGDFFGAGRPVIVSLNYSSCPMLCNTQLTGLINALREVKWTPGKEFDIVSVSIDPRETFEDAAATKKKYAELYGRPGAETGWHFLVGDERDVRNIARAMGVTYRYLSDIKQYVHPAVFVMASPEGQVVRYFYGVQFEPVRTLELSLVEASQGKIGTTLDRVLMYCLHYDTSTGKYTPAVQNIMKLGAAGTILIVGTLLGGFWWRERRQAVAVPSGEPAVA